MAHTVTMTAAMTLPLLLLLLLGAALTTEAASWVNSYDKPISFVCPSGQFLSHLHSVHSNHHEDRIWSLGCRTLPVTGQVTTGQFSGYVNNWDKTFAYQCPGEGFISGMASVHHNHYEDRRFRFLCGTVAGAVAHGCQFTGWQNRMDSPLDYQVPAGKILKGVTSEHNNHNEDRRFNFLVCSYSRG